jgi:branched-chain amino acid transport system permease protein
VSAAAAKALAWRRALPPLVVIGYVIATLGVAHSSLYTQGLCLTAAVFAVLALGVDLVATTGLYTLAQGGLFAIGSYTCAVLAQHIAVSPFVLLPICVVGCAAVGLVLGTISMRVSGLYFTISTFIFTLIVNAVISIIGFTGGYNGISGPILANFSSALGWLGNSTTWAIMAILLAAIGVSWSVRRSALHPVLLAIRDSEPLAAAVGARTSALKVGAFALSAALAGAAGWAFSLLGYISPGQFSWSVAVNILAMVVLGGIGTTLGPILGAAFISIFPAYVNINGIQQELLFGAIFVIVIVAFPSGAMGLVSLIASRLRRQTRPARPPEPGAHRQRAVAPPPPGPSPSTGPLAQGAALSVPSGSAVECRGLVFRYPSSTIKVVNGVDFRADWGTVHGLIGPNGSGKTTLVDLISGRLQPESGTITVAGNRVEATPAYARAGQGLMRTFQSAQLVGELSAQTNVLMGLYAHVPRIAVRAPVWPFLPGARRDLRRMRSQSTSALEFVGAAAWSEHRITDIPHGAVQLTQLANVWVAHPRVIILDEPLAGLSPGQVAHVGEILRELKGAGVCVILIEHQPAFVFALCDQVTVLGAGEVVASGAAAVVREDRQVREVYLGQ